MNANNPTNKKNNPIAKALKLPRGATFHRCALRVNSYGCSGSVREQSSISDAETHAKHIIAKAVELQVAILAITDYNDVRGVPVFQDAAARHEIHVFPGFKLSSSEGVPVLCIYPEDTNNELDNFLGEFGITQPGQSTDLSTRSFIEILRVVRQQGGVTIAAPAVKGNLRLGHLGDQAKIQAWKNENLVAIQIPGQIEHLPQDVRSIIQNANDRYRRDHPAGEEMAIAVVNANNIVQPEDLEHPSATCWIKMSEISVEGLRQAFLDPGSRIRLSPQDESEKHAELVAIAWEGGFLDGAAVHFNQNLNVLVGGRGAGKSTVIESVRYVLGLEPIGEDARKAHEGIVRQVLRSGTKISLLAQCIRPTPHKYTIERTVPNPPLVRLEEGEISNLLPEEVLPRIEVYGQHEISELTNSPEKLTRLLNRFVERDGSLERRKAELRRDLEKNRRSIVDVRDELGQIEDRLATLPALEETLERYKQAGFEERLNEQSLLVREERVLDSIPERLRTFDECLDLLRQEIPIDRAFLSPRALSDLPGREILTDANQVLEHLNRDIAQIVDRLEEALRLANEGISEIRSRWNVRVREVQTAYESILRDLQALAVDGEDFIRLRREIEGLQPLQQRQSLLQRLQNEYVTRRRTLRDEWKNLKDEEIELLRQAARNVGKKLPDRVQVEVTEAGDRESLFQLLRDEIGGRLSEAIDALRQPQKLSPQELAKELRAGTEAVQRIYAIPSGQAERLTKASEEVFMKIEELDLSPTTAIQLNTAPAGKPPNWRALKDLSKGQKATAVLLLLLLDSDAPLIVDQPEDDLDNRFITEGIVPKMREEKLRRQFLFSTHNANIPVLGDAELILGLTAIGEAIQGMAQIAAEHMGSIDSQSIQELVKDLLEGGKDAFETRRLKYGF